MDIAPGTKVRTIPRHRKETPKYGVVTEVFPHDPLNPIEHHGSVAVTFGDGEEEHYTHASWSEFLRLVE